MTPNNPGVPSSIHLHFPSDSRRFHSRILIAALCVLACPALGQTSPATVQGAPDQSISLSQQIPFTMVQGTVDQGIPLPQQIPLVQRQDSNALQEILAFRSAIGVAAWTDAEGTGTLASAASNSTTPGNATLWLSTQGSRLDFQTAQGTQSTRLSGTYGAALPANGQLKLVDERDAIAGLTALPMLMATSFPTPNTMLIDDGIVTVNGVGLHRVSVENPWPGNPVDADGSPLTTVIDLYFDPKTHLLVKSANSIVGDNPTPERYLRIITYEDYQTVAGMQFPLQYKLTLNGQGLWILQLNSVQMNQGLSNADFTF